MRHHKTLAAGVVAAVFAASAAFLLSGFLTSEAVQNPRVSVDMVTTGNTYDDTTNTMALGPIESCLTSATANPNTHTHLAHLVIEDVEDLVGWQARLNYVGDRMRLSTFGPTPFTDNNTGQTVGFVNLPIDQTTGVHRSVIPASTIPTAPPDGTNTPQTALVGATYSGTQTFPVSPDTPRKAIPDDASYDAPSGGVLATLILQVVGNESGQPSLFMNLDDNNPNPPGSSVVVFTGAGTQTLIFDPLELGDGFHGEGATCVPLDCTTQECPPVSPTPTPGTPPPTPPPPPSPTTTCCTPSPTPTATATPTRTPTPFPSSFTGETLILTPAGYRRIDSLTAGDPILSYDIETGQFIETAISYLVSRSVEEYLLVTLAGGTEIRVTQEHPIYDATAQRYRTIKEFGPGDSVARPSARGLSSETVTAIERVSQSTTVYNLHVEDENHNYVAAGILVHNKTPTLSPTPTPCPEPICTPTPTATASPTATATPAPGSSTVVTLTNNNTISATNLRVTVTGAANLQALHTNAPGCPTPAKYLSNFNPGATKNYDFVWPSDCVELGESVTVEFSPDCTSCPPPQVLSHCFTHFGFGCGATAQPKPFAEFVNNTGQSVNDLHFGVSTAGFSIQPLISPAPGDGAPSVTVSGTSGDFRVDVVWPSPSVDPSESRGTAIFSSECTGSPCLTPDVFCFFWTLNGSNLGGGSPCPPFSPATHDAKLTRISGVPKNVRLSQGEVITDTASVVVANESNHTETIGVYVDVAAPPGCNPNSRVLQTTVTLAAGAKTTLSVPVSYSCMDVGAANGQSYSWTAVADHAADDLASCGPGTLQGIACFNALANDDADSSDNRVSRTGPKVVAQ
jgi:Pretoxin HINT domain